jgi:hypothetical protein
MKLELDHVFILVKPGAKVGDRLLECGFQEGERNTHPGQGTANRRFYFANGMLELIWIQNANEARTGPGQALLFAERAAEPTASPFGVIFVPKEHHKEHHTHSNMPFPGWHYQPAYFPPPKGFHVGTNSNNVREPLCFYFPFHDPKAAMPHPIRNSQKISAVAISTPSNDTEGVLESTAQCDRLSIRLASEHLMEITLDNHALGQTNDFRPDMPLLLYR